MDDSSVGGTQWELREAENAMVAADDPVARATAMRRHAEAVRNMMVSELVPSFEKGVGDILERKFKQILDAVEGLQGEVQKSAGEATLAWGRFTQELNTLAERTTQIESALAARPELRLAEHRAIVDEISERTTAKLEQFDQRLHAFEVAFAIVGATGAISEDAVVVIDRTQIITWVNADALLLFGYEEAEIIGQSLSILIPPRFHGVHAHHVEGFAHGPVTRQRMGERKAIFGLHKDGREIPIKAGISKMPDGFTAVVRRAGNGT